ALNPENPTPKYDDGFKVYKDLIARLKKAIEAIDTGARGLEIDNIYGGSMEKWKKYGASIYLRMGMVLADVDPNFSKTAVEDAFNKGVFTSNEDNALLTYTTEPPNRNPIYGAITASGRDDYVIAENLVDKLNTLNDPRRDVFYTKLDDGTYKGGFSGKINKYGSFSHVSDLVGKTPDRKGRLMDYSEVSFLLAEAKQLKEYNNIGSKSAEYHYDEGVKASIKFWGKSDEEATTYLAQPSVQYNPAKYKELIGTQMWIATYNRGYATWLHYRRYDQPIMKDVKKGKTTDKQPPRRLTYPVSEQTMNINSKDAGNKIGGDKMETKLFWDKN
ncbi:starch-binding associating with outer membrane, partial [Elysia marginata]